MLLYCLLAWLFTVRVSLASSASLSNGTEIVHWRSEPDGRGTFGLLFSCLITLTLCVWKAVHLNVPGPHESAMQRIREKMKWVLMGIFTPELVVYVAWAQWYAARALTAEIEKIFCTQAQTKTNPTRRYQWTMVHSFYAAMGGFAIDTCDPGKAEYVPGSPQVTLTEEGIIFLARLGHIPDVSKASLQDRSKADYLAKGLVCIQAGWLIIQCIARVADHLPVTLLEVNTLGHVFCAISIYGLWWYKPLDVYNPLLLTGSWVRPLCALMCSNSAIKGIPNRLQDPSFVPLDPIAATRQHLTSVALRSHLGDSYNGQQGNTIAEKTLADYISNWHSYYGTGLQFMGTKSIIAIGLLSTVYGGLHAAAWYETFPTPIEATAWRASALIVAGCGFTLSSFLLLVTFSDYDEDDMIDKLAAFGIVFCVFVIAYVLSRAFLIIEAFISLRDLPVDAYYTTNWIPFLPHL